MSLSSSESNPDDNNSLELNIEARQQIASISALAIGMEVQKELKVHRQEAQAAAKAVEIWENPKILKRGLDRTNVLLLGLGGTAFVAAAGSEAITHGQSGLGLGFIFSAATFGTAVWLRNFLN
jgi:hypothetical protein